ncbi:MAG: radical SAM protein [Candidatus Diapherotrites archaeon]|nr:radical SAM protein [Candidatus Diapherotrites archaeon]
MVQKKTSILLGYECNNNCRFCYCGSKRDLQPMTTAEAKKQIELGRKRGSKFVDFLGGEPTIRKDIFELLRHAKKTGYETISVTTNGRMLSKPAFAREAVNAGLNSAVFSIHGHTAELHDYLTRCKGSFSQLANGMRNFRKESGGYLCTNTVIVKPNISFLPKIAEKAISLGADGLEFIFPHPRGNAYENFEELVPRLEELIDVVPKTIRAGRKNGIKHVYFRYVPYCYMSCNLPFLSERIAKGSLEEEHIGPEFQDLEVEKNRALHGRVKGRQCMGCKYFNSCEGIFKEYAEKRGFEELVPVP